MPKIKAIHKPSENVINSRASNLILPRAIKCPNCGEWLSQKDINSCHYSISRYNPNKIICSDCGTREAFFDYFGVQGNKLTK